LTTYNFDKVLVWDASPGGVMRLLRGGSVTVVDYATGLDLFVQQSDSDGHATFTTTDVPTVVLRTPKGFESEPITAPAAIAAAANAGVSSDAAIKTAISGSGTQSNTYLNATFEAGNGKVIHVSPDGEDAASGRTRSAAKKTLAAALTAMGAGVKGTIVLGPGDIDAGHGVSWTGYMCGLVGVSPLATRIVATAQTGPVLDLTGVGYDLNQTEFGNFSIQGDGTAGTAKKGVALPPSTSMILANFHDIVVRGTGGAPFDLGYAELCTFNRLSAYEPVSVVANDVPYFIAGGAFNGNTFRDCQINGTSAGANVGPSGAVVVKDNGSTSPHSNLLDAFKLNFLHLPTDTPVFAIAGNGNIVSTVQVFDTGKVVGATGTSIVKFTPPAVNDFGGNQVLGFIPGCGGLTNDFDYGVDVRQSRNVVRGTKGYKGNNVILAAGVANCYVEVRGSISTGTDAAVVDNSGVTTNTIIDGYLTTHKQPATTYQFGTASYKQDQVAGGAFAGMPRFYDPATPANGGVMMGTSGARIQSAGASLFETADSVTFRSIALANLLQVTNTGGVPGVKFYPIPASLPTASATYRGQVGWVQGATGVADRLVVCRKDASDAYAWVDLF